MHRQRADLPPFSHYTFIPLALAKMCVENRADSSARYINAQLKALWENAKICAEDLVKGGRPTTTETEHGRCLYEFYGPATSKHLKPLEDDLAFYARFDPPSLEFVCNHEVILYLYLNGYRNVDSSKGLTKS